MSTRIATRCHFLIGGDVSDRTLVYGYTLERDSFHVYIENELVCKHVYNTEKTLFFSSGRVHLLSTLVSSKRVYPEASDVGFCNLLIDHGIRIPFTTFNEERTPQKYHGKVVMPKGEISNIR